MSVLMYHNPRCSKSRKAKEILEEMQIDFQIKEYLSEGLTKDEVASLAQKLELPVEGFVRKKEEDYVNNKPASEDELIELLVTHPKVLERPIVVNGEKAVVARPPEDLKKLF